MTENALEFGSTDIHIAPGDSAGASLLQCLRVPRKRLYVNTDDLTCGALTSLEDRGQWRQVRRTYWNTIYKDITADLDDDLDGPDYLFNRLYENQPQLAAADHLYLWLGLTLLDRFLLASLVVVFQHLEIDIQRLRMVDFGSRLHRGEFVPTIGLYNCEEIGQLQWHTPTSAHLASLQSLWHAVSSPSPEDLLTFCAADAPHPIHLKQVIHTFMARYPAVDSGLNYLDRVILENCRKHGPHTAQIIGHTICHDYSYPDSPGSIYLFSRLKRLGDRRLAHPLVALSGDQRAIRTTGAVLTATGEAVLNGETNFVALNGIDDWVGGMRLSSRAGNLWFFDGKTLVQGAPV